MATILWSTLLDGSTVAFHPATDILRFDSTSISASDFAMLTWTGSDVIFSVDGKSNPALNHTVHFTVPGGGRALTDGNVTYDNGSKLLIGDDTQSVGNGSSTFDDAANNLTGTAGGDRFVGLGGNDTLSGLGGNDTFVLNNGPNAFGTDSVAGGTGLGDAIGVGNHPSILHGSVVDFGTHMVTSVDGSATFTGIEFAFGTQLSDTFIAIDSTRVLTGLGASNGNFDYGLGLRGYAGNDTFFGDSRPGYFEQVTYSDAPSGVVVNLAAGVATDGYDSDTVAGGIQPYTDTLVDIDGVQGSAFDDLLIGGGTGITTNGRQFENFEGMAGNDTIDANGQTNDRVDYINSPSGVMVNLAAGTASDGWGGTDMLIGIAGVRGSNFGDTIIGDAGNNFLEGRGGNDFIKGGAGVDQIFFSAATSAVNIDLALGVSSITGGQGTDRWTGIEGVRGGDFNDTLRGTGGDNVLEGQAGADLLDGRGGTDLARYDRAPNAVNVNLTTNVALDGYDSDSVAGGIQPYTDTLISIERIRGSLHDDTLTGSAGNNGIEGWGGNDLITGGGGTDTAEYANSPGAVIVDLASGTASDGWGGSDTLNGMNIVLGSAFDDTLTGNAFVNSLAGGAGDDVLSGADGSDTLSGGQGDDTIAGGAGGDYLHGDSGSDFIDGGDGNDVLFSDDGPGTLLGGNGDDSLFGGTDNATRVLDGGAGDDRLLGGNGNDALAGGEGADMLQGNQGNDTLAGGAGNDALMGGSGSDLFRYDAANLGSGDVTAGGHDGIGDGAGEVIGMLGLNDDLHIGGTALNALTSNTTIGSALAGDTNIAFTGGVLEIDLNGNGTFDAANDFQITLAGVTSVTYNATDDLFHLS